MQHDQGITPSGDSAGDQSKFFDATPRAQEGRSVEQAPQAGAELFALIEQDVASLRRRLELACTISPSNYRRWIHLAQDQLEEVLANTGEGLQLRQGGAS